jgi:putative acetyltransferase
MPTPPAGLVLRAPRADDAPGLNELVNCAGYRWGTLRPPYQPLERTQHWLGQLRPGDVHLVALLDERIVGNGGLEVMTGRRRHVGYLGMGVHDDWTRRGIGTAILMALLDAADNWLDLKRIELHVYVDNALAIALYERHGFLREGSLRAYAFRDGSYVDSLALARLKANLTRAGPG